MPWITPTVDWMPLTPGLSAKKLLVPPTVLVVAETAMIHPDPLAVQTVELGTSVANTTKPLTSSGDIVTRSPVSGRFMNQPRLEGATVLALTVRVVPTFVIVCCTSALCPPETGVEPPLSRIP